MVHTISKSIVMTIGKNSGPAFSKKPHLLKNQQFLRRKLEEKHKVVLDSCNPIWFVKKLNTKECIVLWDEIEEFSSVLNDINIELKLLEQERECWDKFECREYDI